MEPAPTFRPARKSDAAALAVLVDIAGEGMPAFMWSTLAAPGQSLLELGRERAQRETGGFSYRNSIVAEIGGEVAASLVGYRLDDPYNLEASLAETPEIVRTLVRLEAKAPGSWYVNVLATFPEFRLRGIGAQLLAIAEDKARDRHRVRELLSQPRGRGGGGRAVAAHPARRGSRDLRAGAQGVRQARHCHPYRGARRPACQGARPCNRNAALGRRRHQEIAAERVILAIGVTGNVEGIGLEQQGVRIDQGHIAVDEWCRTEAPGLYAIGDVVGPPWLAHKASHEGIICVQNIAGVDGAHRQDGDPVLHL